MRVIIINTTAWREEDFYLVTTLDDDKIIEVIKPIVQSERDGKSFYDNQSLVSELKKRYPDEYVDSYTEFDEIIF
jgi:hypothetical protein